jgi:Fic family protein
MLLPDPQLFLYSYVRREAVLSSQIEGTQSSLSDLLLFDLEPAPGAPIGDVVEVSNYVNAMEHGLKRVDGGFPLANRLFREMRAPPPVERTRLGAPVGRVPPLAELERRARPDNAHFVPPPPEQVEPCMAALERFMNDEQRTLPSLARAGVAHVQFETIHPFLDGNGRVGRLLIALILRAEEVLRQPLLYLSLYFKQHRSEYYNRLDAVRSRGDWEGWLDFFLEGVEATANGAVDIARDLLNLAREDEHRLDEAGRAANAARHAFAVLRQRPLSTINEVSSRRSVSFPTAAKGLSALTQLGIAREVTAKRRDRVFVAYDCYLAILSEGTEPL